MHHSQSSNRFLESVVVTIALSLPWVLPATVAAEEFMPVGPFRSVTLRNGGEVIVRQGSEQRVTLMKGSAAISSAAIVDGDRLVIDRCPGECPKRYKILVEVLTPEVDGLTVMNGGTLRTDGSFPRQATLAVAVENGGIIDLRSLRVDQVTAAVHDGGRILTRPLGTLTASVAHGGAVTYWGSPRVTSSVQQGGVVSRGAAADGDKPLDELGPGAQTLPPLPPIPAVPGKRARKI